MDRNLSMSILKQNQATFNEKLGNFPQVIRLITKKQKNIHTRTIDFPHGSSLSI